LDSIEKPIADEVIAKLKNRKITVYQQVLENEKKSPKSEVFIFSKVTGGKVIKTK